MSIVPKGLMSGSVISYEGVIVKVKTVSPDFVVLGDRKEWIGGSQVNPVPLTDYWLQGLGFTNVGDNIWNRSGVDIVFRGVGMFQCTASKLTYQYVHQLQGLFFALTEEHLVVPKLKKKQ